ncbi:NADPH-dependent F420 reductase [Gallaecimonas mangrovi]|uniref:NADPH-dependent F420 reductase n=1 Tax=Gallaecimonas mangrovi TaxID=2291597 RepID=UPI000E1FC2D1|nr:NAD(P)-binding domain-containing protein [Gallaecimonas mangrovi]
MKLGIIGAGFIGQNVAKLALAAGHQVMVANSRGPQTLFSFKAMNPGVEVGTVAEACDFGDMVLLALPFANYPQLPADKLSGKIVLDANNYYPARDGHFEALDKHHTTTSELIAGHLTGATLVKVFNAIIASDLATDGRPQGAKDRRALPIAGDDVAAKAQVVALLDEMGFDAVDAGPLAEGWRFERARPVYCVALNKADLAAKMAATERYVDLPETTWAE